MELCCRNLVRIGDNGTNSYQTSRICGTNNKASVVEVTSQLLPSLKHYAENVLLHGPEPHHAAPLHVESGESHRPGTDRSGRGLRKQSSQSATEIWSWVTSLKRQSCHVLLRSSAILRYWP